MADLNKFERRSIANCAAKLAEFDICFAGPGHIESQYISNYPEMRYERFRASFFVGIDAYNHLLKHPVFYVRFRSYSHILIVQTDAWIFGNSEDLKSFTRWDFAGAPSFLNGQLRGYNGGLSLRNVSKCLQVLRTFRYHSSPREIVRRHSKNQHIIKLIGYKWMSILLDLTIRNNFMYPLNRFVNDNEDIFWSSFVASRYPDFKVIEYGDAIKFAWEHNVAELYQSYPLPFGIHGWWNYHLAFWQTRANEGLLEELGLSGQMQNNSEEHDR